MQSGILPWYSCTTALLKITVDIIKSNGEGSVSFIGAWNKNSIIDSNANLDKLAGVWHDHGLLLHLHKPASCTVCRRTSL